MTEQMWQVELEADLNARETDGFCWSLLADAPDVSLIVRGAIVVAGDSDTAALVGRSLTFKILGMTRSCGFGFFPGSSKITKTSFFGDVFQLDQLITHTCT